METITIQKCPLCGKSHTYELDVNRSVIMKMMTPYSEPEPERYVRFTRLFICPGKNETYQTTISLLETPSNKIKSVALKGIKNG
jgi:hypothetical protein